MQAVRQRGYCIARVGPGAGTSAFSIGLRLLAYLVALIASVTELEAEDFPACSKRAKRVQ